MIIYQSRFLRRAEVWFGETPPAARVDWMVFRQRPEPLPVGRWRPFYTWAVELDKAPAELLAGMDGFTAADIRKALTKDRVLCRRLDARDPRDLAAFCDFYDAFAARKQLVRAHRRWLRQTADAGRLDLWASENPAGRRLGYHLYYADPRRFRSLHSPSVDTSAMSKEERRAAGRANRLLIWSGMLACREQGVSVFDLGGWYNGSQNRALLGINKFKEGFGGRRLREFEGEQWLTAKARITVTIARWLEAAKALPRSSPSAARRHTPALEWGASEPAK